MGSIVVCGGGVIGLLSAMMLARDGHQVTVVEADSADVPATPGEAWESWQRKGVAQFRQPHNLFSRFRQVCDDEVQVTPGRTPSGTTSWLLSVVNSDRRALPLAASARPGWKCEWVSAGRRAGHGADLIFRRNEPENGSD